MGGNGARAAGPRAVRSQTSSPAQSRPGPNLVPDQSRPAFGPVRTGLAAPRGGEAPQWAAAACGGAQPGNATREQVARCGLGWGGSARAVGR